METNPVAVEEQDLFQLGDVIDGQYTGIFVAGSSFTYFLD
jgi:hypothetical protein